MSNELTSVVDPSEISAIIGEVAVSPYAKDDDFASMSSAGGFLPRLMLMGANSGLVKEGKMPVGGYALIRSKESFDDLGKEVPVLPLAWRSKAMEILAEEIISIYDRSNPEFNRIAEKSELPDSGCMYGPEFLLWIPSVKSFGSYFASSKTSRREAGLIRDKIGKGALMKTHLIKSGRHSWFGPVVTLYSGLITAMPTKGELTDQIDRFNNPKSSEKEAAPEGTDRPR